MGISAKLPPSPDFRYVGLHPAVRPTATLWAAALPGGPPLAIVPWGVLVDPDRSARVLRWAAIRSIEVHTTYGHDQATPTTRWSEVVLDTGRERYVGRAPGAVSIERLMAHLEAYAEEAAHAVALDLDGVAAGEGPVEPDVEPLLASVRAWVDSAPASSRLDLPSASYRAASFRAPSARAVSELRQVLRDRTPRLVDPRPFAAMVAAELGARELAADLVDLVQSPHPVLAGVAKVAARKLGASTVRIGTIDEVAPFLRAADVAALESWAETR